METNGGRKHLINGVSNASNRCQLRACSHLSPPENGRFSGVCSNLFNSACGIHCNSGFELHGGSPVRICLPNGQWSGTQPRWKPISNIIDLMHFCAFSLLNIVCLALCFAPHYLWFIKRDFNEKSYVWIFNKACNWYVKLCYKGYVKFLPVSPPSSTRWLWGWFPLEIIKSRFFCVF